MVPGRGWGVPGLAGAGGAAGGLWPPGRSLELKAPAPGVGLCGRSWWKQGIHRQERQERGGPEPLSLPAMPPAQADTSQPLSYGRGDMAGTGAVPSDHEDPLGSRTRAAPHPSRNYSAFPYAF